ncbi:MAG: O-antigen ligase family protein [Candidatus Dormibacteria bacterium]
MARVLALLPLALLPAYVIRGQAGPIPTTVLELSLLPAVVAWALTLGSGRWREVARRTWDSPWRWPILLWTAAALVSVVAAPDHREALGKLKAYFIEPELLFMMLLDLHRERRWLRLGLGALAVSGLTVAVANLYLLASALTAGSFDVNNPPVAIFTTANAVGLLLGPMFGVALAECLLGEGRGWRRGAGLLASVLGIAIVLSYSRAAWLGLLAAVVTVLVFHRRRAWLLGAAALGAGGILLLPHVGERISHQLDLGGGHSSIPQRLALWHSAWAMLSHRPLTGAGLSGFQAVVARYATPDYTECLVQHECLIYPHNLFLNAWSETGIVGLVAFSWILFLWGRQALAARRGSEAALGAGLLGALAYLLVHGMVDVPFWKNDLALEFWALAALGAVAALAARRPRAAIEARA